MPDPPARYRTGDRVRARSIDPPHHTRLPRYVRGQVGEIVEPQGAWPLADERATGRRDARLETVYTVRFPARQLWGAGGHWVSVDLWESYLEDA